MAYNYSPQQQSYNQFMGQPMQPLPYNQQRQQMQPMQAAAPVQMISQYSHAVSSREEAQAVAADFSGAPMIFPDVQHGRIYWKQWDLNRGCANFVEFVPEQTAPEENPMSAINAFRAEIDQLRREVEMLKEANAHGKPADDAAD